MEKKNLQKKEQCRMNEWGRKTSMNKIWLIKIFSIFTSMCYCSNNHRLGRILSYLLKHHSPFDKISETDEEDERDRETAIHTNWERERDKDTEKKEGERHKESMRERAR